MVAGGTLPSSTWPPYNLMLYVLELLVVNEQTPRMILNMQTTAAEPAESALEFTTDLGVMRDNDETRPPGVHDEVTMIYGQSRDSP